VDNFRRPTGHSVFGGSRFVVNGLAFGVLERPKLGEYKLRQRIVDGRGPFGPHLCAEPPKPLWSGALPHGQQLRSEEVPNEIPQSCNWLKSLRREVVRRHGLGIRRRGPRLVRGTIVAMQVI
jgi:hypothetical protein